MSNTRESTMNGGENILFFRHAQASHGRMLTTVIFSPLHLRRPASHSVIVWETEASPTRRHTLNPGSTHSVSSLQRHTLVWSIKRGKLKTVYEITKVFNLRCISVLHIKWYAINYIYTIAGLPQQALIAGCWFMVWPLAAVVLCQLHAHSHTLNSMHLAHAD